MIHLPDVDTVYFDVDDTLFLHDQLITEPEKAIKVQDPPAWCKPSKHAKYQWGQPHEAHIQALKDYKAQGAVIVVWSQGGSDWAKQVVEALGLTDYVDLCVCKPAVYYDDLHCSQFMYRTYIPQNAKMDCPDVD